VELRPGIGVGRDAVDHRALELELPVPVHLVDEGFLAGEVPVDGPGRHAGALGDEGDGAGGEGPLGEELEGGIEDRVPLVGVHRRHE
jgi:hypothetical protein